MSPFGEYVTSDTLALSVLSSLVLPPILRTGSAHRGGGSGGCPWLTGDSHWGMVPGEGPHVAAHSEGALKTRGLELFPLYLYPAACLSSPLPCPSPYLPASPLPTSLPIYFPRERTNKKTNSAAVGSGGSRGEQGTFLHFPSFPDPDLNPHSASCQPGCSQADIAAGAFSAAFPQICLLRGLL